MQLFLEIKGTFEEYREEKNPVFVDEEELKVLVKFEERKCDFVGIFEELIQMMKLWQD